MSYKKIGLGLLLVPLGLLLAFLFGEVFSGDISGLAHLLQILPILLILYFANKNPHITGHLLVVLSLTLGIYFAWDNNFVWKSIFFVEIIVFLPMLLSGMALILSEDKKKSKNKN